MTQINTTCNAEPGWFDITRMQLVSHLAFGHGRHCLGAALALLEIEIACAPFSNTFPALTLDAPADELPPLPSLVADGPARLLVRLPRAKPR